MIQLKKARELQKLAYERYGIQLKLKSKKESCGSFYTLLTARVVCKNCKCVTPKLKVVTINIIVRLKGTPLMMNPKECLSLNQQHAILNKLKHMQLAKQVYTNWVCNKAPSLVTGV